MFYQAGDSREVGAGSGLVPRCSPCCAAPQQSHLGVSKISSPPLPPLQA